MEWLRSLFSRKPPEAPAPAPAPVSEAVVEAAADAAEAPALDPAFERMLAAASDARAAAYARLGALDDDVLAPLINPSFMGGPTWPAFRQAWRVVRRPGSTFVASDGLSDPFEDDHTPLGFRVEVCAEAPGAFEDVAGSWLFELVYQVSQLVAQHGQVDALLQTHRALSTVVNVAGAPEDWLTEDGRLGVLVGFPAQDLPAVIEHPQGPVRLLAIQVMRPEELARIESGGPMEPLRNALIDAMLAQPRAHLCRFERTSVA